MHILHVASHNETASYAPALLGKHRLGLFIEDPLNVIRGRVSDGR
jgi:hypothetical protein